MSTFKWFSSLLFAFILFSCTKPLPSLDNIDLHAWKNDKNSCSGQRTLVIAALEKQKQKLLGLSEQEIISLLGRPDENELYKRNQKFYHYYVDRSKLCQGEIHDHPRKLIVRFNAVGLAKEISIE